MDIYVQSSGVELNLGYRWLHITESCQYRKEPPLSLITNLIESESYSVVLTRLPPETLLLLITSIEAQERRDFLNRQIYISVAWVGKESDELILRQLAASALDENQQNYLAEKINRAVTIGGDDGFQVSFQDMQELVLKNQELPVSQPPDLTNKIGRNSPKMKNVLAKELRKYRLPKAEVPLVVVTGVKERDVLEKARVWRSLSILVDTEDWQPIGNSVFYKLLIFLNFKVWTSLNNIVNPK